jgi:hypothetical protein
MKSSTTTQLQKRQTCNPFVTIIDLHAVEETKFRRRKQELQIAMEGDSGDEVKERTTSNDGDESSYVLGLIQDLALSRSDCISAGKRNDLVKIVTTYLTEKSVCRQALADRGGGTFVQGMTTVEGYLIVFCCC